VRIAKIKRIKVPEGNVPLGPPFNGELRRADYDISVDEARKQKVVYHPRIGWGIEQIPIVKQGLGLAVYEGCGIRVFAGETRERASGLNIFHISIKFPDREPTWSEMNALRDAFFPPDVDVIQVHPKHEKYVNVAQYVWHLWQFPGEWDISAV